MYFVFWALFKMKLVSTCDELEVYSSCTFLMSLTYEPIRFTSAVDWWDQYHLLIMSSKIIKRGKRNITHNLLSIFWESNTQAGEKQSFMVKHTTLCTCRHNDTFTHSSSSSC